MAHRRDEYHRSSAQSLADSAASYATRRGAVVRFTLGANEKGALPAARGMTAGQTAVVGCSPGRPARRSTIGRGVWVTTACLERPLCTAEMFDAWERTVMSD